MSTVDLVQRNRSESRAAPNRDAECPPLENGDHLTRVEFERRFESMLSLKKAELIEGRVFMQAAAVRHYGHSEEHAYLVTLLGLYAVSTKGVEPGDNGSIRVDDDNMPQPDAYLRLVKPAGGQSSIDEDGYVTGVPEFAAEVASSSVSYDLHDKLDLYRRSGLKEYVVWKTLEASFACFQTVDGKLTEISIPADGIFRSRILPGLWIDCHKLAELEIPAAYKTLQSGIDSKDHADFVSALNFDAGRETKPTNTKDKPKVEN